MSFESLLKQYNERSASAPINRRKSANKFAEFAARGSIGAAFTSGLLMAESDVAEAEQRALDRMAQALQLNLQGRKTDADIAQSQALSELARSRAYKTGTEGDILKETGVDSAKAEIRYKDSSAGALVQNANTNEKRANTEAQYKRSLIDVEREKLEVEKAFKEKRIGIDEYNAKSQRLNVESSSMLRNAQAYSAVTGANTDSVYKRESIKLQQEQLQVEKDFKEGRTSIDQYNAATNRIRANSAANLQAAQASGVATENLYIGRKAEASIKASNAQAYSSVTGANTDKYYKTERVGVDKYNAGTQRMNAGTQKTNAGTQRYNAETQRMNAGTDLFYKKASIGLQQEQNRIDEDYKKGRIGVDEYNAVSSRITASANKNLTEARAAGVNTENLYIGRKAVSAIRANNAQTKQTTTATAVIIPKTVEELKRSQQNRAVQKFTLKQNSMQRQMDNIIKQGRYKNESERQYAAMLNSRFSTLRTKEKIQAEIDKINKEDDAGIISRTLSNLGRIAPFDIFGVNEAELKAKDVKMKELDMLNKRLKLFKDF